MRLMCLRVARGPSASTSCRRRSTCRRRRPTTCSGGCSTRRCRPRRDSGFFCDTATSPIEIRPFVLELRRERRAVVRRLPHAAVRGADVEDRRIRLVHGDVRDAARHRSPVRSIGSAGVRIARRPVPWPRLADEPGPRERHHDAAQTHKTKMPEHDPPAETWGEIIATIRHRTRLRQLWNLRDYGDLADPGCGFAAIDLSPQIPKSRCPRS